MEDKIKKLPIFFWIITVVAILWNLLGVFHYLTEMFISPEQISAMKPEMQELYKNSPIYLKIFFGLGVFGGLLGSVGLIRRKSWAITFLLISLIAVILQFASSVLMTDALEVMGNSALILPAVIILFASFIFWYGRYAKAQGLLS